jgi:DUF1680 family protein
MNVVMKRYKIKIMIKNKNALAYVINGSILLLLSILLVCCGRKSNESDLVFPDKWKFQTGDNYDYAKPEFDDASWKTIKVDTFWEKQGYENYDGIAWYRVHVVIPSSLKEKNKIVQALHLSLGSIDDGDETYLNGEKVGGMWGWNTNRSYIVPFNLIQWDKENIIAIRVNDTAGNGGIYGRAPSLKDVMLSDVLKINTNHKPVQFVSANRIFTDTVIFNFKVPIEKMQGSLHIKVYNPINKTIAFEKNVEVTVGSGIDSSHVSSVEIKEPGTYRVDYSFSGSSVADTVKYSTVLAYTSVPHTNEHTENPVVKLAVPDEAMPFDLQNISFGGYLDERLNANLVQRLLKIDEKGILECYYNRPGKQTWVGEYTGKYLHAASRVWQSTKNEQLKAQMDRIVDILIACQNEDGYLGTYLPENYWTDWDVWAHKYNMLGFLSYYAVTGYEPALESSIKMGDLLCKTFGEGKGQRNIIESSGHVGMASTSVLEPMTYLYRYTGDKKYLDFCNYIIKAYDYTNGPKIVSTLSTLGKVDKTANAKAYEMTSNLIGIVKLYQLTGDKTLLKAAENAWQDISAYKLYITGTASEHELYQEDFHLPASNDVNMGEGCVTTTWLQFNQALYYLTGEAKYIIEIEKSIYNHLFAAENPENGCVSYYTALQGKKPYRCTIDSHCCLASIPRGIAAIPELTFTKDAKNGFDVNLYSTSKLKDRIVTKDGKEVVVECIVNSKFPQAGTATITVNSMVKNEFELSLHVPEWCKNFKAVVNGKTIAGVSGKYLNIAQVWDKNATIKISFDLPTQILDGGESYPGYIALKYGAQVLAADQALNPEIVDFDKVSMNPTEVKSIATSSLPVGWIGNQLFSAPAFYNGKAMNLKLVPYAEASQTGGDIRVWIKRK